MMKSYMGLHAMGHNIMRIKLISKCSAFTKKCFLNGFVYIIHIIFIVFNKTFTCRYTFSTSMSAPYPLRH